MLRPPSASQSRKVLVISQPSTSDYVALPGTIREVWGIQKHVAESCTSIQGQDATVTKILDEMDGHSWIHFACHGVQDPLDPLQSAFALQDGKLTLQDLMNKNLTNAEVAFLSACQTAKGDAKLPEEVMHLTAGMLAIGFRSVVGTMWSIGDNDAPLVADIFYESMMRQSRDDDSDGGASKAAYALHDAVGALREKVGEEKFEKWVPFVHYGF